MTTLEKDSTNDRTLAQEAVAEHLRLLTTGPLEQWANLFAPDAVFAFPFAPTGMPPELQGREAMLAHMANFNGTFDVEVVDLTFLDTASPQLAVAEWVLDGTARPTGRSFRQKVIAVVRTDADGRITSFDDYWNPLAAIEALQIEDAERPGASGVAASFAA